MNWQNLISHRTTVDPLELLPQEHNFRIHALNQRQVTTASLDELGHVGDIIVNVRTGKIVNGHLRVELAIAEAQDTVPVTYIDCDVAAEQIILAFFDQVGAKAITDADRLRATISQIDTESAHLQASLDDWVLSFKPKKAGKKGAAATDDDEGEELDDDEEFLDAPAPAAALPASILAPAQIPMVSAPEPAVAASMAAAAALPEVEAEVAPAEAAAAPMAAAAALSVVEAEIAPAEAVLAPVAAPAPLPVVEATAAPEPAPVAVAPAPMLEVVQDDPIAAAIVEDVRAAEAAETPPAAPKSPVVAAPTEYMVKVGEFDQMVPAELFAPWFAALCAEVGNGHSQLSGEVKRRLGFE